MHELTIVQKFVDTTNSMAEQRGIRKVERVTLDVGALTGVIPKYVRMYYDEVCEDTRLEGSELVINFLEAEAFCRGCGHIYDPKKTNDRCPECNDTDKEILQGKELRVRDIAYNE